ncbi:MAG TPA: recombinase family protein [Elusimicrobiota bacterium]|nr:recombinase family protein [Elusimicrobiota bacterium]
MKNETITTAVSKKKIALQIINEKPSKEHTPIHTFYTMLETPEERLERIVELLAIGVLRLLAEQKEATDPPVIKQPSEPPPQKRRIPFGLEKVDGGRDIDAIEKKWVERIQQIASEGNSSEYIAKALNQEDRETKRVGKWSRTAVWRILQLLKKTTVTKYFVTARCFLHFQRILHRPASLVPIILNLLSPTGFE